MARARLAPQSCLTRDAREMYNVHVFGILLHIPTDWFIFLLPPFAPPAASSTTPVQCTRCIGGSRCWARSSQGCVRKEVDRGPAGRAWRRWSKGQCAVCSVFLYSRLHLLFFFGRENGKKESTVYCACTCTYTVNKEAPHLFHCAFMWLHWLGWPSQLQLPRTTNIHKKVLKPYDWTFTTDYPGTYLHTSFVHGCMTLYARVSSCAD